MAAGTGAGRVSPTPASPPRLGLLPSAATVNPNTLGDNWLNGIMVQAEACLGNTDVPGGYWWTNCDGATDPVDVGDGVKGVSDRNQYRTWVPYAVVEGDRCSAAGWTPDEFRGRALRNLEAARGRKVELELWSGQVATAMGADNDWLANPATADDLGDAPLVYALAELVQYLADTITGRGMIHAMPRLVSLWDSANLLRREGNILYENTADHIIVPGTGYTGLGIDDIDNPGEQSGAAASISSSTAYATEMVSYATGDPQALGNWADNIDRGTNTITWRAEQDVLAWWTGCAHGAITVNHAEPCLGSIS